MDPAAPAPPIVLFLCTANSCRSQMAEALARARWGDKLAALSSGVRPGPMVDPRAVVVLREIGIDANALYPKNIQAAEALVHGAKCTLVVTVCGNAEAECPHYRNTLKQHHEGFRDPPALAREHPEIDPLVFYREVRDEIREFIDRLPALIPALEADAAAAAFPAAADAAAFAPVSHALSQKLATAGLKDGEAVGDAAAPPQLGFFEKYLSLWVLLCIIAGALIGYYAPSVSDALGTAQFAQINAIVAVLLWIMIFPMLIQIDFASLRRIKDHPGAIGLTSIINYLVKPFTMYGLAILFFRVFYTSVIPDPVLRDNYIAGLVLLAGAPCTAMVFVWSLLTGGDGAYTLVQVAFNDLLMLALYVPTAALLIGVSNIDLPWLTIIYAVVLFIAAPLLLAATARAIIVARYGVRVIDRVVAVCKPATIVALLATLVLIFIFQGRTIGEKPLHIVLLAVPIIIQCCLNFAICYYLGWSACVPHERLAPASMIATSNFFELAVAVAISVYGLQSGAALATVVGVLVEVPVMLGLVHVCNALRPALEARIAKCSEICDWSNKLSASAAKTCCACSTGCGGTAPAGASGARVDSDVSDGIAAVTVSAQEKLQQQQQLA